MEKKCVNCKTLRPTTSFYNKATCEGGIDTECKECNKARKIRYRLSNPQKMLFLGARKRAKKKGMEFTISQTDVDAAWAETCPYLGIPLDSTHAGHKHRDNSPSLDRIDAAKGYVKGNIQVISFRANTIKNNATLEEFKMIYLTWAKQVEEQYAS